MEKHFLSDFVSGRQEFVAEPWYNPHGDCVVYQTADEAVVRDRIDELLTIYRSGEDNRPIGFQIKGVHAIIRKFGLDGLAVESEVNGDRIRSVSLTLLLLAAYEAGPRSVGRRQAYAGAMSPISPLPQCEIPLSEAC